MSATGWNLDALNELIDSVDAYRNDSDVPEHPWYTASELIDLGLPEFDAMLAAASSPLALGILVDQLRDTRARLDAANEKVERVAALVPTEILDPNGSAFEVVFADDLVAALEGSE